MLKLISLFIIVLLNFTVISQCFNESFSNVGPYGGYQTETWTGDDGYTLTATDARTDQNINGDAICVRNGSLSIDPVPGGIGDLTLTTQRAFSGGTGDLDIYVNGTLVGTIPYDGSVQTTTIAGINIIGSVSLEIVNTDGDRVVMDDLTWTCYASSNTITTTSVSSSTFTVDCSTDDTGTVNFTSTGTFNGGNVFTAELSDATGSFASPTAIGTETLSGTDPAGTINISIPAGTLAGTGYRIRVVSSDPSAIGSDNGTDITINSPSCGPTSCMDESFGNIPTFSSTSYQTRTWTGDDGYTFTATDSRSDQTINGDAVTVRNGSLSVNGVTGGIGDLTLTTQRAFTGGTGDLDVFVNGTLVGTIPYDGTVQTTTITGINISGTVDVEIFTPSNGDRVKMDDLQWTCYANTNAITTSNTTPLTYNVDCSTGDSGTVDFTTDGDFNAGNNFTAQLSDATGSFASPIAIGTETLSGTDPSGTINITIPSGTPSGNGYRIRVISDSPTTIGSDNSADIEIINTPCTISTNALSSLSFGVDCTNSDSGSLDFTSSGDFNTGNTFTVELSDASGSFTAPVVIGSTTMSGVNPSGNISFTIPSGTSSGTGYRIRVVSDDPSVTGTDNGTDITINLSGGPCFQEPPHATSIIINSCNSACGEGNNEVIFANTGDYSVLMNSTNFELTYGSFPSPTNDYTNPLVNNSTTTDDLNTSASCPGLFVDATNTTVPPNATIMLAHDAICPGDVLDFENLCGSGPIYVVYTQDGSWNLSGNFVNSTSAGTRYLTTTITATDGSSHVIDYEFDSGLNTGSDGDYAKWDYNGGAAIEQGNNGCTLDPVVLPVELLNMTVKKDKTDALISWSTASERNNDFFVLSHSTDGFNFNEISTIQGAGTTTESNSYSNIHFSPKEGINYYRLQSVDFDGTTYLKGIRAIEFNFGNTYYDNSNNIIYTKSKGDYNVVNLAGQIVKQGKNTSEIPFIGTGVYIVQNLKTGEAEKLVIQ